MLPCETDAAGRLLALHAPDPDQPGATFALVRYAYDEAGDLTSTTDALGHAARFAYAGHLLTRETFRSGLNFYFEYDSTGPTARCVHTWSDGGIFDTRLHYNTHPHTTVWDSYGHQKEYYQKSIKNCGAIPFQDKWLPAVGFLTDQKFGLSHAF